jgi:hypothetical protein
MSREKLKNIRNFINSAVRTYNYALKALDLYMNNLKCRGIQTEKPQLHAEASVIRVATTYFPTS